MVLGTLRSLTPRSLGSSRAVGWERERQSINHKLNEQVSMGWTETSAMARPRQR
jgi:hypothetical protein